MLQNRYDFILFFDVKDGNPSGGPDGGNLPRVNPEIGEGPVADVRIKRKVCNYIQMATDQGIFARENSVPSDSISEAVEEATGRDVKTKNASDRDKACAPMCQKYHDTRASGAVLSTGDNAGQVRGPVQLTFVRSIDPIFPHEHTITRVAATDAKEQKASEGTDDGGDNRTMGCKVTVPYELYKMYGFVALYLIEDTGFTEDDLEFFWGVLQNMFDLDHSAARGLMSLWKLIIFKHESPLGNASAYRLFERITVARRKGLIGSARGFSDHAVQIDRNGLQGVEIVEFVQSAFT